MGGLPPPRRRAQCVLVTTLVQKAAQICQGGNQMQSCGLLLCVDANVKETLCIAAIVLIAYDKKGIIFCPKLASHRKILWLTCSCTSELGCLHGDSFVHSDNIIRSAIES
uniref:Uncharacterized protein n=1 Tax=Aegilops tauschii TaxID=37682 RepID=M8CCK8_AEGTA